MRIINILLLLILVFLVSLVSGCADQAKEYYRRGLEYREELKELGVSRYDRLGGIKEEHGKGVNR